MSYVDNLIREIHMSKIIFISNNKLEAKKMKEIAMEKKFDYSTHTEDDWATFEDIEHYLNGDDPRTIISLPVGIRPVVSLEEMESLTIKKIITSANGNVAKAAEALNIGRATLYRKLDKYGLSLEMIRQQNALKKDSLAKKKASNVISLHKKSRKKSIKKAA